MQQVVFKIITKMWRETRSHKGAKPRTTHRSNRSTLSWNVWSNNHKCLSNFDHSYKLKSYSLCAVGTCSLTALKKHFALTLSYGVVIKIQLHLSYIMSSADFICDFSVKLHYFLFKAERENSLIRSMTNPKADVSTKEGRFFPSSFLRATILSA